MEPEQNGSRTVWVIVAVLGILLAGGGIYYALTRSTRQPVVEQPQSVPPLVNTEVTSSTSKNSILNSEETMSLLATSTSPIEAKATTTISSASSTATSSVVSTKTASKPTVSDVTIPPTVSRRSDWGTVKTALGFSLQYPYKEIGAMWGDDGDFEVGFYIPTTVAHLDASSTELLNDEISSTHLNVGLDILVFKATTTTADFDDWIKAYLKKEDNSYGNHETVLSEQVEKTRFAGLEARKYTRQLVSDQYRGSFHYSRKEIFARDVSSVYHLSYLTNSKDTIFHASGDKGNKFLSESAAISESVLQTFVFDKSNTYSITVPKNPPEVLTGAAKERREQLLATLRKGPFYDTNATYPEEGEMCDKGSSQKSEGSTGTMTPAPGIYISADEKYADLHGYDALGAHTGPMPAMPGYGDWAPKEQMVRSIRSTNLGSAGYGLSIREMIDGRIELVGKKLNFIRFEMRGEGNSCSIVSFFMFATPRSVATLPITAKGDIGPISYDVDGDGVKDMEISLLHPLTKQKETDLGNVLEDMMKTNNWTFPVVDKP